MLNEVEYGKYDNKKTQSDKIQDVIQQRQLTSYMNNTKWQELIREIRQISYLPIMYKTIFDVSDPEFYWTIAGDEHFEFMNMALIEWFKISANIKECEYLGRLLDPVVVRYNVSDKILLYYKNIRFIMSMMKQAMFISFMDIVSKLIKLWDMRRFQLYEYFAF